MSAGREPPAPSEHLPAGQDKAWQRPVLALAHPTIDVAETIAPSWYGDLTTGQQHIVAAILSRVALSPDVAATVVEQQREFLRLGAMRRSDDIELLTVLVRVLIGNPEINAGEVGGIHRAYEHLRQCHWWPSGPEDLPLAALLVAGAPDADERIAYVERLQMALSEGDEVPGDPCALVALAACVPDLSEDHVVLRVRALRTELLLSGLALQDEDSAGLLSLATIAADAEAVMQEFIVERQKQTANRQVASPLTIALAADAVVLRHLDGVARSCYIAVLAIRAWLVHRHHPQHHTSRLVRQTP